MNLTMTNNPNSDVAAAAEIHVNVLARTERSVAATKSYTAELLTLYLLFGQLSGSDGAHPTQLPKLGEHMLAYDVVPFAQH
ncbi:hypothetical protein [Mycobacterium leprae]|nr:hypothetical protein [Mycobacterium leprae]OAR21715.1 hypothetical protein A8144_00445 [Mycobacterium leprae 3125609]OAX72254.1 hypothetical protein A3216_00510 [Mycobacterium leprae 7935681]